MTIRGAPSPLQFGTQARYALTWEATFGAKEDCFWTHENGKATAHRAFPGAEIARAVAVARRR